jgi:hypothetical protein
MHLILRELRALGKPSFSTYSGFAVIRRRIPRSSDNLNAHVEERGCRSAQADSIVFRRGREGIREISNRWDIPLREDAGSRNAGVDE